MTHWNTAPQGTQEWLDARVGVITASRARDARDKLQLLDERQAKYVAAIMSGNDEATALTIAGYKNKPSSEAIRQALDGAPLWRFSDKAKAYAMDVARQRVGGTVVDIFTSKEMRIGTAEEVPGRVWFEDKTGLMVEQVGFAYTEDKKFGASVDGLIEPDAAWENKVMVSSSTLFRAVIDGDITEYRDQCLFQMWLLSKKRVHLQLYVYDLPELSRIFVIERDEDEIQALEDDMVQFDALVESFVSVLTKRLTGAVPPWEDAVPAAPMATTSTEAPKAEPKKPAVAEVPAAEF